MAFTADQLTTIIQKLETRLASGTAEVRFENRLLRYNSPAEIMQALTYFQGLLTQASGGTRRSLINQKLRTSKGF